MFAIVVSATKSSCVTKSASSKPARSACPAKASCAKCAGAFDVSERPDEGDREEGEGLGGDFHRAADGRHDAGRPGLRLEQGDSKVGIGRVCDRRLHVLSHRVEFEDGAEQFGVRCTQAVQMQRQTPNGAVAHLHCCEVTVVQSAAYSSSAASGSRPSIRTRGRDEITGASRHCLRGSRPAKRLETDIFDRGDPVALYR